MTAETAAPRTAHGRIDPTMVLVVGLGAGVIATVAQIAMWWLAGMPLPETLFRDARLTAALVMGIDVLPPPATPQWDILLAATLVHFLLSVLYALIPAQWISRLHNGASLFAGALYGLAIYVINLYGFTLLFPWFEVVRGWVTLLTHLVFGVALASGYRLFTRDPQRPRRWYLMMRANTATVSATEPHRWG